MWSSFAPWSRRSDCGRRLLCSPACLGARRWGGSFERAAPHSEPAATCVEASRSAVRIGWRSAGAEAVRVVLLLRRPPRHAASHRLTHQHLSVTIHWRIPTPRRLQRSSFEEALNASSTLSARRPFPCSSALLSQLVGVAADASFGGQLQRLPHLAVLTALQSSQHDSRELLSSLLQKHAKEA